jgi:prepilin-type processing-associated H-X9-DG protein
MRARQRALAVSCANQAKQISIGILLYTTSNNQRLPWANFTVYGAVTPENSGYPMSQYGSYYTWEYMISPILQRDGGAIPGSYSSRRWLLLECPADDVWRRYGGGKTAKDGYRWRSYSVNGSSGGPGPFGAIDYWNTGTKGWPFPPNYAITSFKSPSSLIMLTESHRGDHFLNGSGFVAISSSESQFPRGATDYPREGDRRGQAAPGTHDGMMNYVFLDSHIRTMNPYDTLRATGWTPANTVAGTTVDSYRNKSAYWWPTGTLK